MRKFANIKLVFCRIKYCRGLIQLRKSVCMY